MVFVGWESGQDIVGRICLIPLPMLWSHLKVQVGQGYHSSSLSRVAAGWRPSSVPSPVGHSTGRITMWQVASIQLSKQWVGEKGCAQAFSHLVSGDIPLLLLPHCAGLKQLSTSSPWGADSTGAWIPRGGDHWSHSRGCLLQSALCSPMVPFPLACRIHSLLPKIPSFLPCDNISSWFLSSESGPGGDEAFEDKSLLPIAV